MGHGRYGIQYRDTRRYVMCVWCLLFSLYIPFLILLGPRSRLPPDVAHFCRLSCLFSFSPRDHLGSSPYLTFHTIILSYTSIGVVRCASGSSYKLMSPELVLTQIFLPKFVL
ncbi:hypothetical protein V8F20_000539 [Naviculisporaceae sp. PSN 640]